ncbi:phosphotransferase [Virgibacillus dakarensis]|nr:phosphotransferase [Virgibacillus dakarensis]
MNKLNQGDEMRIDRFSSFLYQKGRLDCTEMKPVKSHVFRIKTPKEEEYILKKHAKPKILEQQWDFFEQLPASVVVPFVRFPNGRKYIKHNQYFWTLAPFIDGDKLNYATADDRQAALVTLRQFHQDAKSITVQNPIKQQLFYIRWSRRLSTFKKTEHHFLKYGFETLFRDIVRTTKLHLELVSQLPWREIEQRAEEKMEWVHGDVASHNFIRNSSVYMIDFDLLSRSPVLYDYIQLGQRFLPYLNWDFDKLLAYQMVSERQLKLWINAILVPTDVLREWLHFLKRVSANSVYHYLSRMEREWLMRHSFFKKAKLMLKSI